MYIYFFTSLVLLARLSFCQELHPGDYALEEFLKEKMNDFTSWLSPEDPFLPFPAPITLKGSNLDGIDVNIEIRDHHNMLGYFNTTSDSFDVMSLININSLTVIRDLTNENITFVANYTANGTLNVNETLSLSFRSEGLWKLEANDTSESITYVDYQLANYGFINLTAARIIWNYDITWKHLEFQQVTFEYDGDVDVEWEQRVENAMTQLYVAFLQSNGGESLSIPPEQLINKYLYDTLSKITLSNIIAGWSTTTTPYPTTQPNFGTAVLADFRVIFICATMYMYL